MTEQRRADIRVDENRMKRFAKQTLTQFEYQVWTLHYWGTEDIPQMSYQRISKHLGPCLRTVTYAAKRAKEKMAPIIEDERRQQHLVPVASQESEIRFRHASTYGNPEGLPDTVQKQAVLSVARGRGD